MIRTQQLSLFAPEHTLACPECEAGQHVECSGPRAGLRCCCGHQRRAGAQLPHHRRRAA